MKTRFLLLIIFLITASQIKSQTESDVFSAEEMQMIASTKQLNQFIRRFNNEESPFGIRYYSGNRAFRDNNSRGLYLKALFNQSNSTIPELLKDRFVADLTDSIHPYYLDFHGGFWFAEVKTKFVSQNKQIPVTLFMKLQEEIIGSKWVIESAYCEKYDELFFETDTTGMKGLFLHPMSHELDFMNMNRVFEKKNLVEFYTSRNFNPNHLTLLLYEIKNNVMKFSTVTGIKFHFFQIPGWYFNVEYYNRSGLNSGWLISNLLEISESDKIQIQNFILHKEN